MIKPASHAHPCPWCGVSGGVVVHADGRRWVECLNEACKSRGPVRKSAREAIKLWNLVARCDNTCSRRERFEAVLAEPKPEPSPGGRVAGIWSDGSVTFAND